MTYLSLLVSLGAILFAFFSIKKLKRISLGPKRVQEISGYIQEGAKAFLTREFKMIAAVLAPLVLLISIFISPLEGFIFLIGAAFSGLAGYLGMKAASLANGKCANAASKSFSEPFKIAYLAGSVMGLLVVGLGLLGLLLVWISFKDPQLLIAYAFGSSLIALFLRVGGGIYTKAADIGADLFGKLEKGIPEDDPRNPAVIADAVGDNVGDVAGMGSDLFDSYVSAIIASAILGIPLFGEKGLILPVLLAAAGILSSIVGVFLVRVEDRNDFSFQEQTEAVRAAMKKGSIAANVLMIGSAWVIFHIFGNAGLFWALLAGILLGIMVSETTKYFTSDKHRPVQKIAEASQNGISINVIEGLAQGMLSVALPALGIALAVIFIFNFAGFFGIALASVGILAVLGINLSFDSYGPVVDNAASIAEMAGLPAKARQRTDALDSVGNTTAAAGKGFAITSAGLAFLAWAAAFFEMAEIEAVNIMDSKVLGGLLLGSALSFFFCALSIKGVAKGSFSVVEEIRRQFREIPGIMEGKAKPDYFKTVDLITRRALKETMLPGVLVVMAPFLVGLLLGLEGLGGFLIGVLSGGFLLAMMMANSGGAWDNAKKYIEAGNLGGRNSEAYTAAVVGDTVGDPMKDTAGPSLNILIKIIGKVAVVFIPIFLFFS